MVNKTELLEAVNRLKQLETEFQETRIMVANLLKEAAKEEQVTILAQITKINRTTIYWLMNNWSTDGSRNNGRNHNSK